MSAYDCPLASGTRLPDELPGGPLRLTPALHPLASDFLKDTRRVFELADGFGSPLNVVFPQIVTENVAQFSRTVRDMGLQGRVYMSAKPNKSEAILRQAAAGGDYIDVSSARQLAHAVAAGFRPERISATGPKNIEYLSLALRQQVLIIIDSLAELETLESLLKSSRTSGASTVMLRLADAGEAATALGIRTEDVPVCLDRLVAGKDTFRFIGFAWHASGIPDAVRLRAIGHCLEATKAAIACGLRPTAVNIGGGFRMNFLADRGEWHTYVNAIKASAVGRGPILGWNGNTFGFRNENGVVRGSATFRDHYESVCGAEHLGSVLTQPIPALDSMSAAEFLRDLMLDLYIEPGRAAYDQAGLTIAQVNFRKESSTGQAIVGLNLNGTNIGASWNKLMTDPIVLTAGAPRQSGRSGVFYFGNLCTPADIITHHKTFPDALPEAGDLVAFANTGAYLMDFFESETLEQRVAEKVAVVRTPNGLCWYRDRCYDPLLMHKVPQ